MNFTTKEITNALHGVYAPVKMRFKYYLLDKDDNFKRELTNVISGEVSCNSDNAIKRTAKMQMLDDENIDYLSDKVKITCEVYARKEKKQTLSDNTLFLSEVFPVSYREIVGKVDRGWVEFPLGIFLLSSPSRVDSNNVVLRDVEAYDSCIVLKEDVFPERYTVTAGTNYIDAVKDILASSNITKWNIEDSDKSVDRDIDFEPGTEKIEAINELLKQINYNTLSVDVYGYHVSNQYKDIKQVSPKYTYTDNETSVILPTLQEDIDLSSTPNKFVVVRTNAEQEPLKSVYINDNIDSMTSTINRGRVITYYEEIEDISDQESLDEYTKIIAKNASQIYKKITFETSIMPFHDVGDVIQINYSKMGISEKYQEVSWSLPLETGGVMKHELRRIVDV